MEEFYEDWFDSLIVLHAAPTHNAVSMPCAKLTKGRTCAVGLQASQAHSGLARVTRTIAGSPTKFMVRLIGETRDHPVHTLVEDAGPDLPMTRDVELSAKHGI